ncbi:MAG: hypothetical protein U5L45_14585 [Saprospiraceae bacterium]|nr:hypothetical protein [Saprospiraceae bacterium]
MSIERRQTYKVALLTSMPTQYLINCVTGLITVLRAILEAFGDTLDTLDVRVAIITAVCTE